MSKLARKNRRKQLAEQRKHGYPSFEAARLDGWEGPLIEHQDGTIRPFDPTTGRPHPQGAYRGPGKLTWIPD